MRVDFSPLTGHLDIFIDKREEELHGEISRWNDILIHGDPEGLRSFAHLLLELADLDQNSVNDLPVGAREHIHLQPGYDLSESSEQVIIGRLDEKGTGEFYDRYVERSI